MIISIILVFFAAMFNAVMDKTKDAIQFNTSIFKNLHKEFWCDQYTSSKFLVGTKYKLNAWHFSKSCMLVLLLAIPFFYTPFFYFWHGIMDYLLLGEIWILSFNLFYNHLFRK